MEVFGTNCHIYSNPLNFLSDYSPNQEDEVICIDSYQGTHLQEEDTMGDPESERLMLDALVSAIDYDDDGYTGRIHASDDEYRGGGR